MKSTGRGRRGRFFKHREARHPRTSGLRCFPCFRPCFSTYPCRDVEKPGPDGNASFSELPGIKLIIILIRSTKGSPPGRRGGGARTKCKTYFEYTACDIVLYTYDILGRYEISICVVVPVAACIYHTAAETVSYTHLTLPTICSV